MSDPTTPNYKNGIGRLVTDRYDFQAHVEGSNFRHKANQIDLSPSITIDGNVRSELQEAIQALSDRLVPEVPDATTTVKGILKIAGDVDGTADSITVKGIYNIPVTSTVPTSGDLLTFNGSAWAPTAFSGGFTAAGDLSGNNLSQNVIGITGTTNVANIHCRYMDFDETLNKVGIRQKALTSSGSGNLFSLKAQDGFGASSDGGTFDFKSGIPGAGGLHGSFIISIGDDYPILQGVEPLSGNRVLAICSTSSVSSIQMPANTGDMVCYVGNAATAPSANPVDGAILYASDGCLNVRQSDGVDFKLGSLANPTTWGTSAERVVSLRATNVTTSSLAQTLYDEELQNNASTRADVIIIGKQRSTSNTVMYNYSLGFVRQSGISTTVGILTSTDYRYNGASTSSWTAPDLTLSTNNIVLHTGAYTGVTID